MLQSTADTKKANARGNSSPAPQAPDGFLATPVPAGLTPHPHAGMQPRSAGSRDTGQPRSHLAALHKTVGNQAVLRMLNHSAPAIQAKLTVNQPGDAFEQEADRIADVVMRMPNPAAATPADPIAATPPSIQRAGSGPVGSPPGSVAGSPAGPTAAPPIVHDVLRSPGQPLDPSARSFFEPRFGRDFSHVRIHSGAQPAQSARAVAAHAYTVGSDIVFDRSRYAPQTADGRRLLAHELTHVVQQGSADVAHRLQRDLVYGSAYKNPYKSGADDGPETRSAEAKTWYPSSIDFAATASGSGGGTGAASFDDLISTIGSKGAGSISSLGIIGHASTDLISLSGTITVNPMNVTFTGAGVIDSTGIKSRLPAITAVRDRFAAGAKIILYGCHAGIADSLMAALSGAFQVCVHGFSDEVWWCISWDAATRKINSRGRTFVDSAGLMGSGLLKPTCLGDFNADIGKLTPDKKDCSGVVSTPAPTPKAAQPQGANTESPVPESSPQSTPAPMMQTKLAINTPGDAFEQEADRVAERVMRMKDSDAALPSHSSQTIGALQRKCSCGGEGECAACAEKKEGELQRSVAATAPTTSRSNVEAPPAVNQVLSSPGQSLDRTTRDFMESRFGHDFGGVRVHADSRAAESARAVSALAYTVGKNIVFNRGEYSPGTQGGRRLLAHELTHVVQQGAGGLAIQREDTPFDVEGTAAEIETLVFSAAEDGEHQALVKLDAIADTKDLLNVTAKLYDNWQATQNPKPQKPGEAPPPAGAAYGWLNATLKLDGEQSKKAKAGLSEAQVLRLNAAFDAAKVHNLRNPIGQDKGSSPTLSESRNRSDPAKRPGPVRVGDWGDDIDPTGSNTWVMHTEGVRTYWNSGVARLPRSAQWLGKNLGNFGGNKSVAKRSTGSFKWGPKDSRAIYTSEEDSKADLFDNIKSSATIGSYIRLRHTSKEMGDNADVYIENMRMNLASQTPPLKLSGDDPVTKWTDEGIGSSKWRALVEAFRAVEGWVEGKTYTASTIGGASSKPEDASLVAYYKDILGVPATPAAQGPPSPDPAGQPPSGK